MRPGTVWRAVVAVVLVGCCVVVFGCLRVPLGDAEKSRVDESLVGCWLDESNVSKSTLLCLTQYDARTYLANHFEYSKSADGSIEPSQHWVMKVWLTEVKGTTFLTGQVIGAWWEIHADDPRYIAAAVKLTDGKLHVTQVDSDYKNLGEVKSSDKLEEVIGENLAEERLWRPAEVRARVQPKDARLEAILKAFHME